ncbi:MAG: 6-carboxytetrahydropterin synthase [Bacteroidetes bacterium]|nr:MAG: 6-carboxytetrahydropterin synthase [Bacteroidota bacterium]
MNNKVAVYRKEHFNAAHRLHNPALTAEENERIFGKCNNAHYHGHNYELIVKVVGVPDAVSGYVIDMKVLSDIIKKEVLDRFDHKNLTAIDSSLDIQVRLFETERNFVKYPIN